MKATCFDSCMKAGCLACVSICLALISVQAQPFSATNSLRLKRDVFSSYDVQQFATAAKAFADVTVADSKVAQRGKMSLVEGRNYLVHFNQAFSLAEKVKLQQLSAQVVVGEDADSTSTNSPFLDDPVYITNSLRLINQKGRVIGGPIDILHPDCVAVGSDYYFGGSGTLVAPRLVITAGHCFPLGLTNRILVGTNVNGANSQVYRVASSIVHPSYDADTLHSDLGLLILSEPVTNVLPRAIATTQMIARAAGAYVAGFGRTNRPATKGEGVRRYVGPIALANPARPIYSADAALELVLGRSSLGWDTCDGDSGGPLYIQEHGKEFVAGATSRPVPSTDLFLCGQGGIYTRLDVPWIRNVARTNGIQFP